MREGGEWEERREERRIAGTGSNGQYAAGRRDSWVRSASGESNGGIALQCKTRGIWPGTSHTVWPLQSEAVCPCRSLGQIRNRTPALLRLQPCTHSCCARQIHRAANLACFPHRSTWLSTPAEPPVAQCAPVETIFASKDYATIAHGSPQGQTPSR